MIKDPRTVNKRIVDSSDKVITGEEKQYCKLMTKKEEQSLVRYLLNRNRCRQGVSEKEAEGIVLNILCTRKYLNRRGGRKVVPLSNNAKQALRIKLIVEGYSGGYVMNILDSKTQHQRRVSLKRGLLCTREMASEYLDELADLINDTGIGQLVMVETGVWEGPVD